jgi:hypothetical protein
MDFKSNADKSFKALEFQDAINLYRKALSVDGLDKIVLNSNLSASFFELGKKNNLTFKVFIKLSLSLSTGNYEKSVEHSNIVCNLLDNTGTLNEENGKILEKNLLRLKKCNEFMKTSDEEDYIYWQKKLIDLVSRYYLKRF